MKPLNILLADRLQSAGQFASGFFRGVRHQVVYAESGEVFSRIGADIGVAYVRRFQDSGEAVINTAETARSIRPNGAARAQQDCPTQRATDKC